MGVAWAIRPCGHATHRRVSCLSTTRSTSEAELTPQATCTATPRLGPTSRLSSGTTSKRRIFGQPVQMSSEAETQRTQITRNRRRRGRIAVRAEAGTDVNRPSECVSTYPKHTQATTARQLSSPSYFCFKALRHTSVVCGQLIDHTVVQFTCMDWTLGLVSATNPLQCTSASPQTSVGHRFAAIGCDEKRRRWPRVNTRDIVPLPGPIN